MNFIEALEKGEKENRAIRRDGWLEDSYAFVSCNKRLLCGNDIISPYPSNFTNDFLSDDWELHNYRDYRGKPIKPGPKFQPWNSLEDMGEAANHWFRKKESASFSHRLDIVFSSNNVRWLGDDITYDELALSYEHSPTPWIADSWKPCGKEKV